MGYTNHQYMGKIFQILEKKMGTSAINLQWIHTRTTHCIGVLGYVDENSHPPWSGFLDEFGNLQEHKNRENWECRQQHSEDEKGTF